MRFVLTGLALLTRESESFCERGSGSDRDTRGRDRTPNDLSRNREFRQTDEIAKTSAENEENAQSRESRLSALRVNWCANGFRYWIVQLPE